MDLDELFAKRPDDPLAILTRQDLDRLSRDELHERIAVLETEIARVRKRLDGTGQVRHAADALFRK
ncbi:DUF1192 domain-containing protein [Sandaracinobacteroides saxicola]|uniref:DUF1192 domain-containing protein n=1 Tax=Sandaracinobacteroides saxicola TaxID=2759707 RepID=A0A7G5ILA0_9SPHN|nr:DUF1192 domain-containing protein [Sandaracinobacteroides saxicola]QMW24142.1 DUF1192 domain-containing protein [Sandaracinobacteroides saxicola]